MEKTIEQTATAGQNWHAIKDTDIYRELKTSEEGLTSGEAKGRIETYGANKLPEGKSVTLLQIILHQLINPLIFILVAAAIASIAIGISSITSSAIINPKKPRPSGVACIVIPASATAHHVDRLTQRHME